MKHISAALLLSVLLFHAVLADALKDKTLDKDLLERTRRAVAHQGLINPADLRMLKVRRTDPYRRAPRMKRYRRMAEDPEMFKRGPKSEKYITRVKKIVKS
ncbi:uncharacterized protein [Asterias amurensis]|uniref:uncharacterized protein n=1 Tax=Asterias amurensis TaxID=7602 RepID=UPI003AB64EB5